MLKSNSIFSNDNLTDLPQIICGFLVGTVHMLVRVINRLYEFPIVEPIVKPIFHQAFFFVTLG